MQGIDARAPPLGRKDLDFAQTIRAAVTAILAPIFSLAFVGVPLVIGGSVLAATADVLFMSA